MWSPPRRQWLFVITVLLLSSTAPSVLADDRLFVPRNSFLPADDVALGAEAARVIRAHVPLVKDRQISAFVAELGHRLVDQIPTALRQPAFRYSFDILDRMDATIYALPGGPVFISRGLVQAAGSEKALATAIARQVSHITLRHGTAQATAGDRFQFGAIGGRDIAAVIAGPNHNLVVQGAAFSVASYFLTYGNEFERQADHLALQLLAGTGYGSSEVDVADGRSDRFRLMQTRLPDMPPVTDNPEPRAVGTSGRFGVLVPSGESRAVTAGDSLLLSVPANWDRLPAGNTVMFAPDGALVKTSGGSLSVTHGIQVGTARSVTGNLQADMQALLETLSRAGLNVRWRPSYQSTMVAGRNALTTTLVNVSGDTGAFEQVFVCAAHLPDGNMLYLIGLSPLDESGTYRLAFDRVRESIQPVR